MAGLRLALVAAVLCAAALSVHANRNARIVGGVAHDISTAPWLVQLTWEWDLNGQTVRATSCGGVIVSDRHILTAAHCFDDKADYVKNAEKHILVLAGSTSKYFGGNEGTFYRIKKANVNPNYRKREGFLWWKGEEKVTNRHDIAVLETVQPIQFNDKVQPLQISNEKPVGKSLVYVGGWGHNNTEVSAEKGRANYHPGMHIATLEVMPDEECEKYLGRFKMDDQSKKWLICTRNIDGNSCQGDSGGPMWNHVEGQPPRLVGLVQSGLSCHIHSHGLYVDIADPEIKKFLKKNKVKF